MNGLIAYFKSHICSGNRNCHGSLQTSKVGTL